MMRFTLLLLVLVISATDGAAQREARAQGQALDVLTTGLQLTASITDERFCSGDVDVYTDAFDLASRYTNVGTNELTLLTGTDVVSVVLVAHSAEDLKAAKYEAELNWDMYSMDGGQYALGSNPRSEKSVSLKPGQSTVSKASTAVLVRRPGAMSVPGTVPAGEHFLQIRTQIKVSEGGSAKRVARGGSQRPSFRWVSVLSDPIRFEVPSSPTLQNCLAKRVASK